MANAHIRSIDGALDHLVNQFSDPLSFLRELIQNSVDAGSREIDVSIEHIDVQQDLGTLIIHIDDFGEGMDREIIDHRLTRLFSSSKDGDLTKIGRFGIGFASVFALNPDAVCIDTAKGGEAWRILFRADRTFSRIALDIPVEGTKVQVIKAATTHEADRVRRRAKEILTYWCKHLDAEIRVDGEVINEPFDLNLPTQIRFSETGTDIVAGYTPDGSSFCGFYNKGLTLHEQEEGPFPRIAVKVSSRYLEHTLTRDNVLEDDNYRKVMARVETLVNGALVDLLFEQVESAIDNGSDEEGLKELQGLLVQHLREEHQLSKTNRRRGIARMVSGGSLSLDRIRQAIDKERFLVATIDSPLTDALIDAGWTVAESSSIGNGLLERFCPHGPPWAHLRFCYPLQATDPALLASWLTLEKALRSLLRAAGLRFRGLELGHLAYPGSFVGDWPAISQHKAGELVPLDGARTLGTSLFARRRLVVVNADHPTVHRLMTIAPVEPELAAYLLIKLFFLGEQLDPELDATLGDLAVEQRWTRQSS